MKPEARFVSLVHGKLPSIVHRQSMAFTYTNGTPDQYYDRKEGRARDLWVEYKWLSSPPVRTFVPNVSELQGAWLRRRWSAGQNAWVIVGFPATRQSTLSRAGYILIGPSAWEEVNPKLYVPLTPAAIAAEIEAYVTCQQSPSKLFESFSALRRA